MNPTDKQTLLFQAIDNYDLLTPSHRIVLKVLLELSIDDEALISIKKLSEMAKVSKPVVYEALTICEKKGFIERAKLAKSRITSFMIKRNKLNDIIKHYDTQENVKKKYLH